MISKYPRRTQERTYRTNGKDNAVVTEITASKIHNPHAKYRAHSPQTGTHTKTNMLTIVASPIGKVPMNIDCTGCVTITRKISGYSVYRRMLMIHPMLNRSTFSAKIMTEIQYSQTPLYGRLCSKIDTMPVPIVTENHLVGVKLALD